jgi:hypothetical protein
MSAAGPRDVEVEAEYEVQQEASHAGRIGLTIHVAHDTKTMNLSPPTQTIYYELPVCYFIVNSPNGTRHYVDLSREKAKHVRDAMDHFLSLPLQGQPYKLEKVPVKLADEVFKALLEKGNNKKS